MSQLEAALGQMVAEAREQSEAVADDLAVRLSYRSQEYHYDHHREYGSWTDCPIGPCKDDREAIDNRRLVTPKETRR